MVFNMTYNPAYADPSSLAYKTTVSMIETKMLSILQNRTETASSDIIGVTVTALRKGSVVVDVIVSSSSPTFQASDLQNGINNAIAEGWSGFQNPIGPVQVYGKYASNQVFSFS